MIQTRADASLLLGEDDLLPLLHRAIRDELQRGGTFGSVVLVLAGLAAVVVLAYLLQRWYDRTHGEREEVARPYKLFAELLGKLEVSPQGRQLLQSMAQDQGVKNPTALLISRELFDRHAARWCESHPGDDRAAHFAALGSELFQGPT